MIPGYYNMRKGIITVALYFEQILFYSVSEERVIESEVSSGVGTVEVIMERSSVSG